MYHLYLTAETLSVERITAILVSLSNRVFGGNLSIAYNPRRCHEGPDEWTLKYLSGGKEVTMCFVSTRLGDSRRLGIHGGSAGRTLPSVWGFVLHEFAGLFARWVWQHVAYAMQQELGASLCDIDRMQGTIADPRDFHTYVDEKLSTWGMHSVPEGPSCHGTMLAAMRQAVYEHAPVEFQPIQYSWWQRMVRSIKARFK